MNNRQQLRKRPRISQMWVNRQHNYWCCGIYGDFCPSPAWGRMVEPLWGVCWCNKLPIRSEQQAGRAPRRPLRWWLYSQLSPCGPEPLSLSLYVKYTDMDGWYKKVDPTSGEVFKVFKIMYTGHTLPPCPLERMHLVNSSWAFLSFAVVWVKGFAETIQIVAAKIIFLHFCLSPCRFLLHSNILWVMDRSSRVDEGGVGVICVL